MRMHEGLIIGGGPSGLAVAVALEGDTVVLEKEAEVGGLCRSIEHSGGVFDIGGHSFHTPHPDVHDLVSDVLEGGLFRQARDARVYSHGQLLPYPFQRFFDQLHDLDVVRQCEEGLRGAAGNADEAEDFQDYIVRKFGTGIAEHFMLPYNRKLWARDIRSISCEWTSERVAAAKGTPERFEEAGGKRKPLQPDTMVGYPRTGGFVEIFRALSRHVPRVERACRVVSIDPMRRRVVTADGREYAWRFLVSTIALPELVRIVDGVPHEIITAADQLEYMSLRVELLLIGRRLETPIQRIYVADPDILPHKIALNHNSSDSLRARSCHAIMAEVSLSAEKDVDVDDVASGTAEFLCRQGVLKSAADVVWTGHVNVKYAYPVYTHERPELVARVKDFLEARDIHSVGRFGDWEYINSDRCIKKGLDLGHRLRALYREGGRSVVGG